MTFITRRYSHMYFNLSIKQKKIKKNEWSSFNGVHCVEFNRLNTIEIEIEIHTTDMHYKFSLTLPLEIKCHTRQTSGEQFECVILDGKMERKKRRKRRRIQSGTYYIPCTVCDMFISFKTSSISTARVVMN